MLTEKEFRHVRVTLEKPWRGGALLLRMGSNEARKNPNFVAGRPETGAPFTPGEPILLGPITAGDAERDSTVITAEQAKHMFGDWDAPQNEITGRPRSWTQGQERQRIAMLWGWFKIQAADGTQHPPMGPVGPPDVPFVALRPLDAQMRIMKAEGKEIIHRPREYYGFDNDEHYAGARAAEAARGITGQNNASTDALREQLKSELRAELLAELKATNRRG